MSLQRIVTLALTLEKYLPKDKAAALVFSDGVQLLTPAEELAQISPTVRAALEWPHQDETPKDLRLEIPFSSTPLLLDLLRCAFSGYLPESINSAMQSDSLVDLLDVIDYLCIELSASLGEKISWTSLDTSFFGMRHRPGYKYLMTVNVSLSVYRALKHKKYGQILDRIQDESASSRFERAASVLGYSAEEIAQECPNDTDRSLTSFIENHLKDFYFCGKVRCRDKYKIGTIKPGVVTSTTGMPSNLYPSKFLRGLLRLGVDPQKLAMVIVTRGIFDLSEADLDHFGDYPLIRDAIWSYFMMRALFPR